MKSTKHLLLTIIPFFLLLASCKKQETLEAPEVIEASNIRAYTLNPGDTLGESMQETGLPAEAQNEIIGSLGSVFSPRQCKSGDRYEILVDTAGKWVNFKYYQPGLNYYMVEKSTDGRVSASKQTKEAKKVIGTASGTVQSSLWEAMASKGVRPELIVDFADIFAWQIDFLTEPRPGDTYKVVWESYVTADSTTVNGKILAAQYTASGDTRSALLFTNRQGDQDYYTPEGRSLRSAFLKAPLQYRRISSYFTKRRFHPILKYFRPHLGIDYAAPVGTPVSAIGEGVVTYAGWKGGNGKFVVIRHNNGYASYYGHLSRIARTTKKGARVHQGQVIGNVGSTGLSSGPHLDFRVSLNGTFVNFLSLKFVTAGGITASDRQSFDAARNDYLTRLTEIR